MNIKILTVGCCNRHSLFDRVESALESTDIDATVERIEDMDKILQHGVMSTPALIIDGEIQLSGRSPSTAEITNLLERS